jgi:O-antigen ligase/Tfp pilus assembly protein PilF
MVPSPAHRPFLTHLGVVVIASLFLFSPLLEGGETHTATMIIRLIILAVAIIYSTNQVLGKQWRVPRIAVGLPVALFLLLTLISTIVSPYTNQSVQWLMVYASYAGLLYLLAACFEQWEDVATVRSVIFAMAAIQALIACIQVDQGYSTRASGTFFNPNFLAGYLATASVLLVAAILYADRWTSDHRVWMFRLPTRRTVIFLWLLALFLAGLLQTGSRGGALSLVVGTGFVFALRYRRFGLIGLSLLVGLAVFIPNPIRERFVSEHAFNPMAYSRWHIWQSAAQEMVEHPLGIGIGLYQYTYPQYAFPIEGGIVRYGKIAFTPHNEYLQIGLELGLIGLAVVLVGLALVGREAFRLLQEPLTRSERGLAMGLCGGIVVILTQAMVDSNLHQPALAILLIFCLSGVLAGRGFCQKPAPPVWVQPMKRPALWALICVGVIGFFAFNIIRVGIAYHYYESGTQSLKANQVEDAVEHFQKAILLDSKKSLYHNSLAGVYFRKYQNSHHESMAQASIEELQTAITLNPLDGRLQGLLAHASAAVAASQARAGMRQERDAAVRQAIEAFQRAIALEPYMYAHRFELGHLMLVLGRPDEAEQQWKKVMELEPNYLPARESLTELYAQSGRRTDAQREYEEIVVRQKRFATKILDPMEQSFMRVDLPRLERLLSVEAPAT